MVVYLLIDYPQLHAMPLPDPNIRSERYNLEIMTPTRNEARSPWWQALTVLALTLAVAGAASLAYLIVIRLAGGQTWTGLTWVSFIALPLAFVLMLVLVGRAVLRRRRL